MTQRAPPTSYKGIGLEPGIPVWQGVQALYHGTVAANAKRRKQHIIRDRNW